MSASSSASILLVEDHPDLSATVGLFLENEGFVVEYAADGAMGYQLATEHGFDAIILDVNLPKMNGFQVCERLRNEASVDTPILMLTARDQLDDKLEGFQSGADDYLVKPFDLPELHSRLAAMIRRRRGAVVRSVLEVGSLKFDEKIMEVTREGQVLKLTPVGMKILKILMRESPSVVKREDLVNEVWGDALPDTDALRSHMYQLRRSVDKPFEVDMIHTVPGIGFQLN